LRQKRSTKQSEVKSSQRSSPQAVSKSTRQHQKGPVRKASSSSSVRNSNSRIAVIRSSTYIPPAPITALVGESPDSIYNPYNPGLQDTITIRNDSTKRSCQDKKQTAPRSQSTVRLPPSTSSALTQVYKPEVEASTEEPHIRRGLDRTMTDSMSYAPQPASESGMRFDELYRLKGVLGTGAFSTVREGFHRSDSDNSYAVKCVNRKKLSDEDEAALLDEVAILRRMKHIHIIRLFDLFTEPSTYYLVMERMRGGELFDRIVAKAYYNEKEARDTCKILLEAVGYCHQNQVAHRDLKPENLLLLSEHHDSEVKIADFGFAKIVKQPNSLTTQCGTPGYVAPEILEGTPYDERADMWSVGVILYILLGGYPPFIESTQRDLFRKIRKGEYEFHEEYWGTVSSDAKDLIARLLTVDPATRLTAEDAIECVWITAGEDTLAGKDLGVNLEKLKAYNARRKFKAVVHSIMAANKLQFLGENFKKPSS